MRTLKIAAVAAALVSGCAARPAWDPRSLGDIAPPVLREIGEDGAGNLRLDFDEPVLLVDGSLDIAPPCGRTEASPSGTSLVVLAPAQVPGAEYALEAAVEDAAGNSTVVVVRFTGYNPDVPRLLVNELITRGSDEHPDIVELRVLEDGDLAGVAIYQGTAGDWTDRLVFPACRVRAGEYVLVHFKPDGTPVERDETGARDESGGKDSSPTALDFWIPGGRGLAGNNGVVSLYDRPNGRILDGILYSNRSSSSDTAWGGFGSASTLARARELVAGLAWVAQEGTVRPEDAVNPEASTATRSIARASTAVDTNSREDWHITPTRGATWGATNCDRSYAPAAR